MQHRPFPGAGMQTIEIERCVCVSCKAVSYWHSHTKQQIYPNAAAAPMPHPDMPAECQSDYLEARQIFVASPRSAAALLRLCVQRLLVALGGSGKRIDDDIAALVARGLPAQVINALDICRVVGNNAVHPGEIDVNDDPELVANLFELINFIVRETIEREKSLAGMMSKLPAGAIEAITRRDSKAVSAVEGLVPRSAS